MEPNQQNRTRNLEIKNKWSVTRGERGKREKKGKRQRKEHKLRTNGHGKWGWGVIYCRSHGGWNRGEQWGKGGITILKEKENNPINNSFKKNKIPRNKSRM